MSKPFDFFKYKNGGLSVDGLSLEKIADSTGTPVYVYSAEAFLKPLRELKRGLALLDHTVCFAVKANSNIAILKLMHQAGAGMDLVSGGELYRAGLAEVPGDRIVFSGVGKTPAEMIQALEYRGKGIFSFHVESTNELQTLNEVARRLRKRAPVALRFNPDVDAKTHPYISTGLKKNKFGINRKEILQIAKNLHQFTGVSLQGISIHIGSQLLSLPPLRDAFIKTRALLDELNAMLSEPLSFVDLGGGLGITYGNENPPRIDQYCKLVQKIFGAQLLSKTPLKVLIEPGRLLSGNAGVLLTEILYRKTRKQKDFLIVDAAMNDLMRPALYGSYHGIVPVRFRSRSSKKRLTDVVGPVCESSDCFGADRSLPVGLSQGDLLAILSTGAYGYTMANNYNSRPRPPEVLVQNGKFHVIRKRESYEGLVRGESL